MSTRVKDLSLLLESVCRYYEVGIKEVKSKKKYSNNTITYARHTFFYLASKHSDFPLVVIANKINRANHATVIHSVRVVEDRMDVYKSWKRDISNLERIIRNQYRLYFSRSVLIKECLRSLTNVELETQEENPNRNMIQANINAIKFKLKKIYDYEQNTEKKRETSTRGC